MIPRAELLDAAARFGVAESQVARDHLLSHVLAALADFEVSPPVFFGGTALCRTHLLDWRLSEDLDLLVDDAADWQRRLDDRVPTALRRDFPGLTIRWRHPGLTRAGMLVAGGLTVEVQLVPLDDSYRRYPVIPTPVALRYSDVPETVQLPVPTLAAAVAMKLNAWADRRAPRDLADLFALAQRGAITAEAVALALEVSHALGRWSFAPTNRPDPQMWRSALAAQMAEIPDPTLAFDRVRDTVAAALGW